MGGKNVLAGNYQVGKTSSSNLSICKWNPYGKCHVIIKSLKQFRLLLKRTFQDQTKIRHLFKTLQSILDGAFRENT